MMNFAKRSRGEAYDATIPVPSGWKFIEERRQVQLAIAAKEMPRFKLVVDTGPLFSLSLLFTSFFPPPSFSSEGLPYPWLRW